MNPSPAQLANLKPTPPFEQGNTAAVKHGAFSARLVEPRAQELADALREVVPCYAPADEAALQDLAWTLAQIEKIRAHIDEHGLITAKGDTVPVEKRLLPMQRHLLVLLKELGMTPKARASLGLDVARTAATVDAATALSEPDPGRRRVLMEAAGLPVAEVPRG